MEPTIYIDVVFLVSWAMDSFLLWAAGRIAGFSAKGYRIFLGGLFSAIFYCFKICFWGTDTGFLQMGLFLAGALLFAYYPKNGRNWLRLSGSALMASFLMGGGVNMLFVMTQAQQFLGMGITVQKAYPWWLLVWSFLMAYGILKLAGKWLEANIQRRKEYCTARVFYRGRCVEGRMLIDTGNGLKKGNRGVAVLQLSLLLPLFSAEEQVQLLLGERNGLPSMSYTSLGNPDGRLWGIGAEKLVLSFGGRKIVHKNIFVGINEVDFTGAYEGLVPPCLLEEDT